MHLMFAVSRPGSGASGPRPCTACMSSRWRAWQPACWKPKPNPNPTQVGLEELQRFAAGELPPYQLPKQLRLVDALPRNAMGKVNKKQLVKDLFATEPAGA